MPITPFKTSAELINEAASDIGALGPGEALSAEDYDRLDNKLDGLIEQLGEEEDIYIADKDEIPSAYFLILARLLGNVTGAALVGSPLNDEAWKRDIRALRRLVSARPSYETLKPEFY